MGIRFFYIILLLVVIAAGCTNQGDSERKEAEKAYQSAVLSGDPQNCMKLKSSDSQSCITKIAENKNDISICGMLEYKYNCISSLAVKTGDVVACSQLEAQSQIKNNCFLGAANRIYEKLHGRTACADSKENFQETKKLIGSKYPATTYAEKTVDRSEVREAKGYILIFCSTGWSVRGEYREVIGDLFFSSDAKAAISISTGEVLENIPR
ncbi:MAG: hypothetical protein HY362_02205 [Candidatus Aenigmarchaeota archaeon]|nr:hypothetical protein [Candidatus Aenigmarchaeota archaeon]